MFHVKHFRRRTLFALVDFLAVVVVFLGTLIMRVHVDLPGFTGRLPELYLQWLGEFATFGLLMASGYVVSIYLLGIYDEWQLESPLAWAKKMLFPNLVIVGAAFSWLYISKNFDFPRSVLITFFVANVSVSFLWRTLYFSLGHRDTAFVALIGKLNDTRPILDELSTPPFSLTTQVLGVFSTDPQDELQNNPPDEVLAISSTTGLCPSTKLNLESQKQDPPVFPLSHLASFCKQHPETTVIMVPSQQESEEIISQVLAMTSSDSPIYLFPSLFEILIGRLRHVRINDLPLVEIRLNRPALTYITLKRGFDLITGVILLILAAIPMLIITLAIRATTSGPAIFVQERVGRHHQRFPMYKFRTMILNAEADTGPVWSQENDPRITRLGRFLRETRLDELPQLINIIKGDMSFVGPRPERPHFVSEFEKSIPGYRERLRVRPGVTGLAQVSGNYDSSPAIKLKYDLAYLVNQSFIIDLEIMLKTARSVLTRRGR